MKWIGCVLVLAVVLMVPSGRAGSTDPDAAAWSALKRREVLLSDTSNARGIPGIRALFLVKTQRERFWRVLVDYDRGAFPDVKELRVVRQDDDGAEIALRVSRFLMQFDFTLYRRYESSAGRLTWERTGGDFEHVSGSWEIRNTDDPGTILVIYESYVDAGFWPAAWTRRMSVGQTESMIEHLRHWVERE